MSSVTFAEPTRKDQIITYVLQMTVLAILVLSGFFVLEQFGFILWLVIIIISISLLVLWHSSTRGYRCSNCGHEFEITFWQDLPSVHYFHQSKMLKCPKCNFRDYATELVKKRSTESKIPL